MSVKDDINFEKWVTERTIGNYLMNYFSGTEIIFSEGNVPWDFSFTVNGKNTVWECKNDKLTAKYPNFFVEVENSKTGKPSGIAASLGIAQYTVYAVESENAYCLFKTQQLYNYALENGQYKQARGDNNSNGYTVPRLPLTGDANLCKVIYYKING